MIRPQLDIAIARETKEGDAEKNKRHGHHIKPAGIGHYAGLEASEPTAGIVWI